MAILKSGEWLSLCCLTADLAKGSGGKIIQYAECRIARLTLMVENKSDKVNKRGKSKSAEHNYNFTINLELKNGQIRKIHPILITHINNLPVI